MSAHCSKIPKVTGINITNDWSQENSNPWPSPNHCSENQHTQMVTITATCKNSGCDDTVPFALHRIDTLGLLWSPIAMQTDAMVETTMGATLTTFILNVHCGVLQWWQCNQIIKYQPLKYVTTRVHAKILEMHETICKTHAVEKSSWQRVPSTVCNAQ